MASINSNKFFSNAKERAASLLKNKEKLNQLLQAAGDKFSKAKGFKKGMLVERLRVISRMIRAYVKGEYRQIKTSNILLLIAAVVYFVMPLDLIPDFIPITGFVDDFSIIIWVYGKLQQEIDAYLIWEQEGKLNET